MTEQLHPSDKFPKKALISIRAYNPMSDSSFIYATWLKGLRYGNSWFELIDHESYYQRYHDVIEALFNKPTIEIKVACLKDDPEIILGYSVFENDVLHWVFVKYAWRKIGIARDLIPRQLYAITHMTDIAKCIITAKYPHIVFNPFLI